MYTRVLIASLAGVNAVAPVRVSRPPLSSVASASATDLLRSNRETTVRELPTDTCSGGHGVKMEQPCVKEIILISAGEGGTSKDKRPLQDYKNYSE